MKRALRCAGLACALAIGGSGGADAANSRFDPSWAEGVAFGGAVRFDVAAGDDTTCALSRDGAVVALAPSGRVLSGAMGEELWRAPPDGQARIDAALADLTEEERGAVARERFRAP